MTLRYMALIDAGHVASPQQLARYDAIASENGMSRQLTSAGLIVYAEPGTPVLHLADSAVIIGWLFENGTNAPLRAPASLKRLAAQDTCRQLIDHCWGEYLLLHGGEGASPQPMVMRDPSGGVPCLYSIHQGEGFLGSDLELARQFTGQPLCVDLNFLPHLLAYPHMKTARTGLIGINELLPGTALRILPHGVAITQTWSPWDFVEPGQRYRDIGRATDDVRTALEATITSWARVDDSLLLELSGGLDSSIIAVCLQKSSARIEPCTLLTPVPGADERTYAAAVASAIGRPLHVAEISLADACFDCSPQVDSATPRVTALQVAIDRAMAATAASAGTQSYYSGGGGDTIFCALGNASPAADALRQRGLLAALSAVRDLSELHLCTLWKAARLTLRKLSTPPRPARSPDYRFSSTQARAVECEGHPWYSAPANAAPGDRERIFDLVNTQSFRDSAPRSRQGSLRLPLLSQPVLETCLRVPSWMWIAQGRNRSIARAAFSDMLPSNVLNRRSKGTFMSYSGAAYRYHLSRIRPHLLDGELATTGLLDLKALANFLDDPHPTDDGSLLRIFDLCMIENWLRQHGNRH